MNIGQYMRQERNIATADKGGIRERIMWGHRLLGDPDAFAKGGESDQLRPNTVEKLVREASARGLKLSEREIQYRLKAARTYTTENEIAQVLAAFDSWWSLIQAGFPSYEAPEGEPPVDYRTKQERAQERTRILLELIDKQGALFPADKYEPTTSTIKELLEHAMQMREMTARFAEQDRKRDAYLDALIKAADGDLSMTWKEAHDRLDLSTEAGAELVDGEIDPPLDPEDI